MRFSTFALGALPLLSAAYLVEPDTPASPDTIDDCTYWQIASETDTCANIAEWWGITIEQFNTYNPSQAAACNLTTGNSYCIEQNWGVPPATPTPTPSPTSTTSQTPKPTPTDLLGYCESEAGGYKEYCPRCLSRCQNTSSVSQCFYSTFSTINYYDSQCWQHGGNDCANKAADIVCPRT